VEFAYVLDEEGDFDMRCNMELVRLEKAGGCRMKWKAFGN